MAHLILRPIALDQEIGRAVHRLFWLESAPDQLPPHLRFLPNGYPNGLIPLTQGGTEKEGFCGAEANPHLYFTHAADVDFGAGTPYLWVKWQPWALGVMGKGFRELSFSPTLGITAEEVRDHFGKWIMDSMEDRQKDLEVERAVAWIFHTKGREKVQEMVKETHFGLRRLEQKFQEKVGVSPKQLSRDVRMRQLAEAIQQQGDDDLLGLAIDHGFFDQAHFIREVRHYTQETPRQFARTLLNRTRLYDLHLAV